MKHVSEEDLILLYYGEPDAPEGAREHLRSCAECAGAAEALRRTMELCDAMPVPEAPEGLAETMWERVVPQLAVTRPRRSVWGWLAVPAVGFALAVLAFLAVRPAQRDRALPDEARRRILAISLADHLDRSQMLLTELANAEESDGAELEPLRVRAQELLEEGRLMRQWIARREPGVTLAVVDEVERVLTEAANGGNRPEEIRALREQIGEDSLVFKVRIVEANLRTEGQKS